MLKTAYQYNKGTWTTFAPNDANGWKDDETDIDYLTKMSFETDPKYARSDVVVQNQLLKVTIHEVTAPQSHGFEVCIYVALRNKDNQGAMILISDMRELIQALSLIQPVTTMPFSILTQ